MRRRHPLAQVVAGLGIFLVVLAAGVALAKIKAAVADAADPGFADRLFGATSAWVPASMAVGGLALAFGAGVVIGVREDRRGRALERFVANRGWQAEPVPSWMRDADAFPLARAAKPAVESAWGGASGRWAAWAFEVDADYGWSGAKARLTFPVYALSVESHGGRVEIARSGRAGDAGGPDVELVPARMLRAAGWKARSREPTGPAAALESVALARVLERARLADHFVVERGAIWTSTAAQTAMSEREIAQVYDELGAVAHALLLQRRDL